MSRFMMWFCFVAGFFAPLCFIPAGMLLLVRTLSVSDNNDAYNDPIPHEMHPVHTIKAIQTNRNNIEAEAVIDSGKSLVTVRLFDTVNQKRSRPISIPFDNAATHTVEHRLFNDSLIIMQTATAKGFELEIRFKGASHSLFEN